MLLFELMSLELPYRCSGLRSFEIPDLVARGVRPVFPRTVASARCTASRSLLLTGGTQMAARSMFERSEVWQLFVSCTELEPARRPSASRVVKTLQRLL